MVEHSNLDAAEQYEIVDQMAHQISRVEGVDDAMKESDRIVKATVNYETHDGMGAKRNPEYALNQEASRIYTLVNDPSRIDVILERITPSDVSVGTFGTGVIDDDTPLEPDVIDEEYGIGEVYFLIHPENVEVEE